MTAATHVTTPRHRAPTEYELRAMRGAPEPLDRFAWMTLASILTPAALKAAREGACRWAMKGTRWDEGLTDDEAWEEYGPEYLRSEPQLLREGLRPLAPAGVRYFASGTNDVESLQALAALGVAPGVAVQELTRAMWRELVSVRRLRSEEPPGLFVDSGAFSETREGAISDEEWRTRLAAYGRLVAHFCDEWTWSGGELVLRRMVPVYVVAPDRVGDQDATLRRLSAFRREVRALGARGARVIVPVQPGRLTLAAFWRETTAALGPGAWIAGIPCKPGLTCPRTFAAFAAEARPGAVHFLGLGPTRDTFPAFLRAAVAIGAQVSCDSGLKRRLEGTANGPGGGPRAIGRRREETAHLGDAHSTFAAYVLGVADAQRVTEERQLALFGAETPAAVGDGAAVHVALLSCTKLKHEGRHPARVLYTRSAQFRKALALANARRADAVWILSAKHGAVPGDRDLDYYQQELPTDDAELRAWGDAASRALVEAFGGRDVHVTLLAGAKYAKHLRLPEDWRVDAPLHGVRGPGRRMALLDALTAAARRSA